MKRTVVIAANFTIEPILATLEKYFSKLGIDHEVLFAPFDQIFQQLIDPSSNFHDNRSGVNAIFLRIENLLNKVNNGRANLDALVAALKRSDDLRVPLFLFICAPSDAALSSAALARELGRAERRLTALTESCKNLLVFGYQDVLAQFGIVKYDNPVGDSLAYVSYADQYYAALGIELVRRSDTVFRKPHKVLVLDCDNTLWDGVCGEDGTDGIELPEYRIALQQFAVEQSQAGMVVCLCSKNNEPDVWDVFERRREMRLGRQHLASWRINWKSKSVNLKSLADELQLGLDSFIFVDDDPAVCAEVQKNCPEVFTLLLPREPQEIAKVLQHIWLFDRLRITDEDRDRSQSYRTEARRRSILRENLDIETFLRDLQLDCDIVEMKPTQIARVSQLSLRTNQFNSTTKRLSEADVAGIASEANKRVLTVTVRDRFGDYGLVGAVTCRLDANALYVDAFLLSCRALGRGVEHQILRHLGSIAASAGLGYVDIEFIRSEKNTPIFAFLNQLNNSPLRREGGSTIYRISIETAIAAKPTEKITDVDATVSDVAKVFEGAKTAVDWQVYSEIAYEVIDGIYSDHASCPSALNRDLLSSLFLGPRTETERLLLQIWESHLNLSNISVLDNYFEVGGDSLLGVSLFVEIEEALRCRLPLSVLISSPTIASLAAQIDAGSTSSRSRKYLVPIQEHGDQRPLYCMHAAGGNVLFYRDLSKELGNDQPVYALQARGIADKGETAHERVEDMAADYLGEIRSHQPTGPYRLCGSSFGGLVAFEIARQLEDVGETVELLALFDTYAPGFRETLGVASRRNLPESFYIRYRNIRDQIMEIKSTSARIKFIVSRLAKITKQIRRRVKWRKNQFALQYAKATGNELPKDIQRNHKAIDRALKTYVPYGTYEGQIVLFRAENRPTGITSDSKFGWEAFTNGPIVAIDVKGSHGALTVYPFATDLAAKLRPFVTENNANLASIARYATMAAG